MSLLQEEREKVDEVLSMDLDAHRERVRRETEEFVEKVSPQRIRPQSGSPGSGYGRPQSGSPGSGYGRPQSGSPGSAGHGSGYGSAGGYGAAHAPASPPASPPASGENVLYYLPVRARGEALAMIAAQANIPFRIETVSFTEWSHKEQKFGHFPRGSGGLQLPVLKKADGTYLAESLDIVKYLAGLASPKLLGDDPAASDRVWNVMEDPDIMLIGPIANLGNCQMGPFEDKLPGFLAGAKAAWGHLASHLRGDYFGGRSPSYADFQAFHFTDLLCTCDGGQTLQMTEAGPAALGPAFQAWWKRMEMQPGVVKRFHQRPQAGSGQVGLPTGLLASAEPWKGEVVRRALS